MKVKVNNLEQTYKLAKKVKKIIQNKKIPFYVLLKGDLGAGKTTFTKALLEEFEIKQNITSPSFVIMNQYFVNDLKINHMDAYRLNNDSELEVYLDEFLDSLNIIEWYENIDLDLNTINKLIIEIKIIDENKRLFFIGE
ncbi:tRNA (adenosine(37)-N6)-threonylcarbamoyltransferase complex ATPase subunit type 1 TsaE [Mycoplasma capricolum subsp. capripneumoniae]|uniref:tRNA threonylcarbamoyladenosine biosynthesis protein TsaE n=1 Tax=Mycoplasma capricolum subsp. capripneumoniae 87001 TaxID=1124992 RepID=A0A9N7G7A5_MYCCC|nr:tRNA (adenosine(37)-N6)-threonylcarbamoyltransferase complex ATPase subunit type 1 TsaE [Mycoplasma capricolum]AJK51349.1 YjeE family ATPase [Mycoplasma capricolum subsp. capripneumoniae 87001]AOQ22039.1 tRNA (adenosine(37)-N6)-threonylcarbamoyltransferase complex ATPase subunit type 1 TsaE [Mycoplasma capricolum subsp. capripneumoniae M1601]AQU77437.1 tRNA (adenosine(37)-N6)-threonylcarbamoyltransferase complex ATPase subunit type 1 TsaE [Mycoplasma capricolum subsp. capripneumoniae]KEY8416